jgi:hypothetical protein
MFSDNEVEIMIDPATGMWIPIGGYPSGTMIGSPGGSYGNNAAPNVILGGANNQFTGSGGGTGQNWNPTSVTVDTPTPPAGGGGGANIEGSGGAIAPELIVPDITDVAKGTAEGANISSMSTSVYGNFKYFL